MTHTRVLLADDHALVRAGFRALLEQIPDVEVVGEAADGPSALELLVHLRPHVALLDITMPGLNGLDVAARAVKAAPRVHIVILSMHVSDEYARRALAAGAAGYLVKAADRAELELALKAVMRGEVYLSPGVSSVLVSAWRNGERPALEGAGPLTARQREVLQLVAEGFSTKQIASRLGLSVKTVETHRTGLMKRLNLHDVAALVRYAVREGLVSAE